MRLNTVAHYGGPQLSHQNQMFTANYKSLTADPNRSQQMQFAHSKLQIAHSKLQIAHSKFKSLTANSNRSQQIKVAHSKFKSLLFVEGSFSSVEGTLSRVPILQRDNLIIKSS